MLYRRRPLHLIELTGWRRVLRQAAFFAVIGSGLVAIVAYFLPAVHRNLDWDHPSPDAEFLSHYAGDGVIPVVVLVSIVLSVTLLRKRTWGAGFAALAVVIVGSFFAIMPAAMGVLFQGETAWGDAVYVCALETMVIASIALAVVEPVVFLLQRRRLSTES